MLRSAGPLLVVLTACPQPVNERALADHAAHLDGAGRQQLVSAIDAAAPERTDVVFRDGNSQTLLGTELKEGDVAPPFDLGTISAVRVSNKQYAGKTVVISVVPSLDTPVCEAQTSRLALEEAKLPPGVELVTISRDLPHAQRRFIEGHELKTTVASDFYDGSFGRSWGLIVKETGLLARSVWVIDSEGKIAYRQLVEDQRTEPDYDALIAAANRIAGSP